MTVDAYSIQTTVTGDLGSGSVAVYAFADYDITLRNAIYTANGKDNGNYLTDLEYSTFEPNSPNNGWVIIESSDGTTDYRATVTIDLGYCASGIKNFFLRTYRNNSINADVPNEVKFYVSENGNDFTFIGNGKTLTSASSDETSVTYTFRYSKTINGRYIRTVLNCRGGKKLFLNEVGATARGNVFRANYSSNGYYTDQQGLQYKIIGGRSEITGFTKKATGYSGTIYPSEADFNANGSCYTLGIGSGNQVNVTSDFIGADRINYSGTPNNIQYIVIHNTGTIEEETNAKRYNTRMHNTENELSWHYTVDDKEIYHSLADEIAGWHAGSEYNYKSIGIEICVNGAPVDSNGKFIFSGNAYDEWVENRFRKSLKNAAILTAELLTRYGLDIDSVVQHNDATDKNCPMWLRYKDGKFVENGTLWIEFLGYVKDYYRKLNGSTPTPKIQPLNKITIPDYISDYTGRVYPVSSIGHIAFNESDGFVSILTLGKHITKISPDGLAGSGIYKIVVPDENKSFSTDNEGNLFDLNGNIIYSPHSDLPNIPPNPKDNSDLIIYENDGNYYLILTTPLSVNDIAKSYGTEISRAYTKGGTSIYGSIIPTTGAVIVFADGAKLTVAATGDIDGDGKINSIDYVLLKRYCFGSYKMTFCERLAADIYRDEDINVKDYSYLKRYCFGTYNIYQ